MDLIIARFILMRGISYEHVYVVDFSSKIVTIGLGLLWISGIGFLVHYGIFEPAKLQNPKIWAKIAIVAVLSINGLLVHYFVLPRIRNQVGKRLLDGLSPFDCSLVLLAGTVSTISWYVPLILGAIPQLNYVVPAEVILGSYALLLVAVNTVIQGAIVFFLGGYSIPVISDRNKISDRSKMNILRGSFALALGSICVSLFMTKATDHGTAFIESTTRSLAGEPKVGLASKEAELASSRSDSGASGSRLELEQSHVGVPGDAAVTAVRQSEEKVVERTVLVKSNNTAEQELLDRTRSAESFASLSKSSLGNSPPQLKSGFVGLWAADARACEFRPGAGSDLRTVIGERSARAGGNSCAFKEKKQIGNSEWEMKATCADGSARWESTVRLSVSKNKLKWSGQRGTQIYVKCT
ncbi:hypothetical protein IVB30_10050 [Bradyrhizobium sp. 200]|uniref:hypothetical protein n=1 Tax=Bradyrhizobium sp. 200 TaxID=2782665 RepID=UPI001FFF29D6|nr:hypothetical protein [Bradyrhizobium sp. 200]UPJ51651.1 hypothetical protein IVB30_10050 [Bradyrhizobium sp. 200]